MKTRIEEAAEKFAESSYSHERRLLRVEGFLAGAEFMQGEVETLKNTISEYGKAIDEGTEREQKLEAQNEIMRKTLEIFKAGVQGAYGEQYAREALKKVGEG